MLLHIPFYSIVERFTKKVHKSNISIISHTLPDIQLIPLPSTNTTTLHWKSLIESYNQLNGLHTKDPKNPITSHRCL